MFITKIRIIFLSVIKKKRCYKLCLVEGCSDRTVAYYKSKVERLLKMIETPIRKITTDEIRNYLAKYQERGGCSKAD